MRTRGSVLVGSVLALAVSSQVAHATTPTKLAANAYLVDVHAYESGTTAEVTLDPEIGATLTDAAGKSIVGRVVAFTARGAPLCSGVTDENGYATCAANSSSAYTARFAGDAEYAASVGEGGAIHFVSKGLCVDGYALSEGTLLHGSAC